MGRAKTANRPGEDKVKHFRQTKDGKDIIPVLYHGRWVGHGIYMAGKVRDSNDLICDATGKPVPYKAL